MKEYVGLAAHCSKANKQARLVDRKVCFILDASSLGSGVLDLCPKADSSPSPQAGRENFIDGAGVGIQAETAETALTVILKLVIGSLTSINFLKVELIFSSRVSLFPFLCGQFSGLWQLMSWTQSDHRVVNFST